jgi:hypothetical protein
MAFLDNRSPAIAVMENLDCLRCRTDHHAKKGMLTGFSGLLRKPPEMKRARERGGPCKQEFSDPFRTEKFFYVI